LDANSDGKDSRHLTASYAVLQFCSFAVCAVNNKRVFSVHPFERNFECLKGIKAAQKLIATTQTEQTSNNYTQN